MFLRIGVTALAIIAVFLGYVAFQSTDYVISKEITINAPAERISPYLNNSKLAERWSPCLEVDPQAKMTYSGPDEGACSRRGS